MPKVKLKCSCGNIQGNTEMVSSDSGTRVSCCCDDCQKFAEYLGQAGNMLDHYGGTDIFQMPISHIDISQGNEQIACVRLSSKGMYRWYAKCCNTPIGNSMGPGVPFIGVIHNFMSSSSARDVDLGESLGYFQVRFSKVKVPKNQQGSLFRVALRILSKLILWKIQGLNKPSVFFTENGDPITKPNIHN